MIRPCNLCKLGGCVLRRFACHIKHNTSRRLGNGITLLVTTSGSWRQDILLLLEPVVACQHAQRSAFLTSAAKGKLHTQTTQLMQ